MIKEFLSLGLFLAITAASVVAMVFLWRRPARAGRAAGIVCITAVYLVLTYLISLWATQGGWPDGMFFMMAAVYIVPPAVVAFTILLIVALFGGDGKSRRRTGMIVSFGVLAVILLALVFNKYLRLAWYWMDVDSPDPKERAYAVLMIGETGLKSAEPMILSAINDPSPQVRESAVLALASLDDPETVSVVRSALSDEDPGVRRMAVMAVVPLGRGGAEVVSDLKRMLGDPDPYVRDAAVLGLDGLDPEWRTAPDVPEEYRQP
ncbi:MAG: HEAT repeat domain-containing protein [Deltaproteobacteria bacterium]|nr:HEAT repeat domain-containing protein [Candidatus Zymogenaceae bacterium]